MIDMKELEPLSDIVVKQIKKGRYLFVPSTTHADERARHMFNGIQWHKFPSKSGTIEGIGIMQHDESGELIAFFGNIDVSSVDGIVVCSDRTESGGGHKLSEVPKQILSAVTLALKTDRSAYGARCYQLFDTKYNTPKRS